MRKVCSHIAATAVVLLALPAAAIAGPPSATTGDATTVSATGATLNGSVVANGEQTTYYFEYGTTEAYGTRTPTRTLSGSGKASKDVSEPITGLTAATTYHFRLVAVNPSGTDLGANKTFATPAAGGPQPPGSQPSSVTLAAASTVVTFGQVATFSGKVTGQGAAGAAVILRHTPHPFTAPFQDAGVQVKADAAGAYRLTVAPKLNTRYQVAAKTSPPATSNVVQIAVRPSVGFRLSDTTPRRGQLVRFYGTVTPAHDGRYALIQKRSSTGVYRTVVRTLLRKSTTAGRSVYGRSLRIYRSGTYRIRVPADADHANGTSRARRLSVG